MAATRGSRAISGIDRTPALPERAESGGAVAPPREELPLERDRDVAVLTTAGEDLQRVPQLEVDLERVAVGVVEVDALLADVVDRAGDLHAALPERGVGVLEGRLVLH